MAIFTAVSPVPLQFVDANGDTLNSGTLEFYLEGTTTATDLFSDNDGTSIGTTITLNSQGKPESGGNTITLFRDQSIAYDLVLKDSAGTTISTSVGSLEATAPFDSTSSTKLDLITVTSAVNLDTIVQAASLIPAIVGTQERFIRASDFYLPTASPAGALAVTEPTAGFPSYQGHPFDGGSAEYAEFVWAPKKKFDLSTVTIQHYWVSSATDTDGVAWNAAALAISDGEAFETNWGTAVTVIDNAQSAANELLIAAESGAITIGGSVADSDLVAFRIGRDPANSSDGHSEDAVLLGVKLRWTSDALNDA